MSRFAAVIPAAGLSSRMGRLKPLLPLGNGTVLSRCVSLFRQNGIDRIVVVTGNRSEEVAAAARAIGAEPVYNGAFGQGMFSSIVTGVGALDSHLDGFYVLPVDIPLVLPETVGRLLNTFCEIPSDVLYPRFQWQRGHPPLIRASLIPEILSHDGTGGLRAVLEAHESGARDLDVADSNIVRDMDRPEDYETIRGLVDKGFPSDEECDQLWAMYGMQGGTIAHCRAVATLAGALCGKLNRRSGAAPLNTALVRSLALTHDIGKGTRRHEREGKERLCLHGFPVAAEFAMDHFDMELEEDDRISEEAVVFLADKLVKNVTPVPLRSRFLEKIKLFGHEPGAEEAILGRMYRAESVMKRVSEEIGISPEALAREVLGRVVLG